MPLAVMLPPLLKYLSVFISQKYILAQDPHHSHREVPFGRQPLGEVVEGIWLGADGVTVTMDLVE